MSFRINTEINSLRSLTSLDQSISSLTSTLERLSSGLRINKAADDASGMFIADSLRTQANSLGQAIMNTNDAIGIAQIADKAIDEQTKIMDTVKQKLIQSAQDGQTPQSRQSLQSDINKLLESFQNIATTTSYNGQPLLSGAYTNKKFQVGAYSDQTANLSILPTSLDKVGTTSFKQSKLLPSDQNDPFGDVALKINDVQLQSVPIGYKNGEGLGALSAMINANSNDTGVRASYVVEHKFTEPNQPLIGGKTPSDFTINDVLIGEIEFDNNDSTGSLITAINNYTLDTGIVASIDPIGGLVLHSPDGRAIKIDTASPNLLETLKIAIATDSFPSYQIDPPNLQVEKYRFAGTVEVGDTYTVGSMSYTVQPTDTSINDIIVNLVTGLNGGTATGLSGTPITNAIASRDSSGVLKLTATSLGATFSTSSVSTSNVASNDDQNISYGGVVQSNFAGVAYVPDIPKVVQYALSSAGTTSVEAGDVYTIDIDGVQSSYTATLTDKTTANVITGLYNTLSADPNFSSYTFSIVSGKLQISGNSDYTVTSSQTKNAQPTLTFSTVSNTQDGNVASNWGRASATLVLTNSTLDTNNVFTVGDTVSFNYSSSVSINYTVIASDIDATDPTGAKTNNNVLTKLANLINSDPSINGTVTAQSFLEQNASYIYQYDNSTPYNPSLNLTVNNNIAVLNIYEDAQNSWTPLYTSGANANNKNFTLTGNVATGLFAYNIHGTDQASVLAEIPIVASVPEITTFSFSASQISPGVKVNIEFDSGYSWDYSYTIKSTDTTIDNVISGINAGITKVRKVDSAGNTTLVPMATLVNNGDGTITMTSYATLYSTANTLNSTNVSNSGSFSDTNRSNPIYMGDTSIENSMYSDDVATFTPTITTTASYVAGTSYQAPQAQIVNYTLSGTVETNDIYTLGGISYTVQQSDATLSDIADKLVLGLNGGHASGISGSALNNLTASKDVNGDILLTADVAGVAFAPPSANAVDSHPDDQSITRLPNIEIPYYSELGGLTTVGKLTLVQTGTGSEIAVEGTNTLYSGMSLTDSIDHWVHNLLNINATQPHMIDDFYVAKNPIQESLSICDSALKQLDTIRSSIGSFQKELEATMASISVSRVMTISSESQIRDTDFAKESAEFSKHNLLTQAGNFALAQSNADLKRIEQLLQ